MTAKPGSIWSRTGLRLQLLLGFGLLSLLIISILMGGWLFGIPFLGVDGFRQVKIAEVVRDLDYMAETSKQLLSQWIRERRADVAIMATDPLIREAVGSRDSARGKPPQISGHLKILKESAAPYYDRLLLVAADGRLCGASDGAAALPLGLEAMVPGLLSQGATEVVCTARIEGKAAIIVSRQIFTGDGTTETPAGIIIGLIPPTAAIQLFQEISPYTAESTSSIFLTDYSGHLLSSRKQSPAETVEQPLLPETLHRQLASHIETTLVERTTTGRNLITAYRTIPLSASEGWGLAVSLNYDEALRPLVAETVKTALFGSALTLLTLLLISLLFTRITTPLRALHDAVIRMQKGDLGSRAPLFSSGGREIITLASAFNEMADKIQGWQEDLEQQVQVRTLELEDSARQLKESEQQYRSVVENTDDLITRVNTQGRILFVNATAIKYWGLQPDECIGLTAFDFIHPDDRGKTMAAFQGWLSGNDTTLSFENRQVATSGTISDMLWTISPLRTPQGDIIEFISIARDISSRKRTEIQIRRRADELVALNTLTRQVGLSLHQNQIVAAALNGMINATSADMVLFFTRDNGLLRLAGAAPDSILATMGDMSQHLEGECLCGLAAAQGKAVYSDDINLDARCTLEECKRAGFSAFAALPLLGGEEVIGVLGLASYEKREFGVQAEFLETLAGSVAVGLQNARLFDAARRAEKEVRELNAGLEDKVSERTAQLQETNAALSLEIEQHLQAREEISWLNNDLLQRSQELERANTELETFSYSISHDLKAPLRHLIGFSRILQEDFADTLPPEAANFIDRIDRSSRKMVVMVDALLELSRITKSVLCRKQVDLSAMARELVTELRETSPDREVTVEIAEGLTASADPILIRVVLQNLLGNAWKYSRNVPHARIGFFATEEDGTTTYGIRDNGTGFDMAHTDKLFGAFQRLHGAEFEGTGIGLATVQRIIHRHGGKVWAESRPGAGATFHFTLG